MGVRGWPETLPAGQVRVARPTDRLDEVVRFYRDGLGLPELARFAGHAGYSGVILGLPGQEYHLEFTHHDRGSPCPAPTRDNLLVFYLDGPAAAGRVVAGLTALGYPPVAAENPFWTGQGALTVEDPDGWRVVLMPHAGFQDVPGEGVTIDWYTGDRAVLRPLFGLAEDSAAALDSYLADGRVLTASLGGEIVGHLQLVGSGDVAEIKNMAVREDLHGRWIGRLLVRAALDDLASEHVATVEVATATADIGNLRFYQRQGFRMRAIERDAFTESAGYPSGSVVDGIPLRDRVWLDRPVTEPVERTP
jgi:GNAT superfamily N-acetyltransferase